ncbi:sulfotransferase family cytosolic 1B member 1 [Caerostris extrusa]|uniref:Sulfotransferase family cytosolic 1B member 1 n=1 Tax=Caerostris extrusa TaxID=172846 RepID=A0AAV4PQ12_CAEEX|nr:sulfotransferase family cytosolic 1B member 1 [Caerostris extrusa]
MKNLESCKNFVFKEDDILVVSFPKTGTTWLQEIIYCIMNGIDESLSKSLEDRFPYLEFIYPGLASIEKMEGQRLIKTHLPYSLLPEDIIKSNLQIILEILIVFFKIFSLIKYPMVLFGNIMKKYGVRKKDNPNILILFYEDFHKDIHGSIRKISRFLNKDLTEKEICDIADHCSFSNMSQNPNVNYQHWDDLGIRKQYEAKFMRKVGQVGDWKNYFNTEMNHRMDSWIDDNFGDIKASFVFDKLEIKPKE